MTRFTVWIIHENKRVRITNDLAVPDDVLITSYDQMNDVAHEFSHFADAVEFGVNKARKLHYIPVVVMVKKLKK